VREGVIERSGRLGLVLALLGLALTARPSPAVGVQGAADGIDLNGTWKLDGAYVLVTHRGKTVKGNFPPGGGGECFDGKRRPYAIDAELTSTTTPAAIVSSLSGKLWVCTRSPDLIQKCAGRVSSAYETSFEDATAEPNRISGMRRIQLVEDCAPSGWADEKREFALTRDACTELERVVAYRESDLRSQHPEVTSNLEAFTTAHSAAQARYGESFAFENTPWPTSWLMNPYFRLRGDYTTPDAFFETLNQLLVVDPQQWTSARTEAQLMTRDGLLEAAAMVREMSRIEGLFPSFRDIFRALEEDRRKLEACRQANPAGA
jgi:hypothetical protein